MMDLSEIRKDIDRIDRGIVELYEERMKLCGDVADYKISTGKKVLDKERELEKLQTLSGLVKDENNQFGVKELFTQIMAISRKHQYKKLVENGISEEHGFDMIGKLPDTPVVVYQGEPGSYAYEATVSYFGEDVNCHNVSSWRQAMEEIKRGKSDYGVFPIDNSTAGVVGGVYDLLVEYDNYIVAETFVKVNHALLGVKGSKIEDIKTIYSHPQALMQCEAYLREKNWTQMSYSNTATSALKVSEDGDKSVAAIASKLAGKLYNLDVLAENINSSENNTTRFVIVGNKKEFVEKADKLSLCFEIVHESGSLYNTLSHIIYNGLNMTKIESRPIPEKTWEYRFFIDIDGNINEPAVQNAVLGMKNETNNFRILGNYEKVN